MKKPAFTIVEFMIVMAILSIMFLMSRQYFSNENKIYYAGESCINNMFYNLREISNAALLWRTRTLSGLFLSGGNNIETPDRYNIVLRTPSKYSDPQFIVNVENASWIVQALRETPSNLSVLGSYDGEALRSSNITSWAYLYRGTGDIDEPLDLTGDVYGILYLPVWWINYPLSPEYTPVKGCANAEFFVTYTISSAYPNTTALRVGFQNSASINARKMLIQPSQWFSWALADVNTGAITFRTCNTAVQCKESHRIFFDTRVSDMFLQKCSQYGTEKKCAVWQGGNIN